MDATQWGARKALTSGLSLTLLLTALGCGNQVATVNSSSLNGQNCSQQAKADSFLVKWTTEVPEEYLSNRLHPQSLITRFSNTDKATVENEILKTHLGQYEVAEYEFNIEKIEVAPDAATATCTSGPLPNAWGPADIDTSQAWSYLGKQGDGVIVAVVDSGADVTHQLLASQIWTNSGEVPNNGIDDDKNGLIDDYNGYDFNGHTSSVSDDANHGTHVSGIIAGQAGPNSFTGIAPHAKIMPLKFINGSGEGGVGDAITAIDYATAHGAKVINASWGGTQCSDLLKQDISKAVQSGTVFVNAAGNDGRDINNPQYTEWPAAFQIPGKLTVGSSSASETLSYFSNYGVLVDFAAPGDNIVSLVPQGTATTDNQLCVKSGTSMATPFASGVAALLLSAKPTASPLDIANSINNSVVPGNYGVRTHGKIDALSAAQYLMTHIP